MSHSRRASCGGIAELEGLLLVRATAGSSLGWKFPGLVRPWLLGQLTEESFVVPSAGKPKH